MEPAYRTRWMADRLRLLAKEFSVVVLTGARQTGKSTLLQHEPPFCDWHYLTLDDPVTFRDARRAPEGLWRGHPAVVVDEVQRAPQLLRAIKVAVDRNAPKIRFALSGSANLLLLRRASESLAGRAYYANLLPMTMGEVEGCAAPDILTRLFAGGRGLDSACFRSVPHVGGAMVRGTLPRLLTRRTPDEWGRWWESYVETYLERDLRALSRVADLADYRRVMAALALRTGQIVNYADVSRTIGISQSTVGRYARMLEASCLLLPVPGYSRSRTRRLIKAPKIYFADAGLASHLAEIRTPEAYASSSLNGVLFETFVLLHLRSLAALTTPTPRIFYWRDAAGHEVDFVLEAGGALLPVEVKATAHPGWADVASLLLFLKEYPEAKCAVLLHQGTQVHRFGGVLALPWTALWSPPIS